MSIIVRMLPISLMIATPIMIAALGGLFSERSGVVNIGLEGIMMVGGFTAATVTVLLQNNNPDMILIAPWIGLVTAIIAGAVFSSIHAYVSISLKSDQTVSGTALNLLAGGLTVFLAQIIFDQQRTATFVRGIARLNVPFLKDIPVIGEAIFTNVYPTNFVAWLLIIVSWFFIYKTRFGLRLRSCGEYPQAASSMGVSVYKMRYIGVLLSGAFAGLAGGIMVLTQDIQYTVASIHGIGFIALASLIFGKWKPSGIFLTSLFFGFSQTLAYFVTDISFLSSMPNQFFWAFPYVVTIVALIIFSNKTVGPKAAGEIYDEGKR